MADDSELTDDTGILHPWEKVAQQWQQDYPQVPTEQLQSLYNQHRELGLARQRALGQEDTFGELVGRHALPVVSAAGAMSRSNLYGQAKQRFEAGNPAREDYQTIADYERMQEQEAKRNETFLGSLGTAALKAPAMFGEALAGGWATRGITAAPGAARMVAMPLYTARLGAQTALMPSMYAEDWTKRNLDAGRDALHPAAFPAAFGVGMINNAILGQLSEASTLGKVPGLGALRALEEPGLATFAGRQVVKGLAAPLEQAGADLATGKVQDMVRAYLPALTAKETHYGTISDLANGKYGEAGKNAAVQALTFAVFGMVHEGMHGTPEQQAKARVEGMKQGLKGVDSPVLNAFEEYMGAQGKKGVSAVRALRDLEPVDAALSKLARTNPNASRADVLDAMRQIKGPAGDYALALAKTYPEEPVPPPQPPAPQPAPQAPPGPGAAGAGQTPAPAPGAPPGAAGAPAAGKAPFADLNPQQLALAGKELLGKEGVRSAQELLEGLKRRGWDDDLIQIASERVAPKAPEAQAAPAPGAPEAAPAAPGAAVPPTAPAPAAPAVEPKTPQERVNAAEAAHVEALKVFQDAQRKQAAVEKEVAAGWGKQADLTAAVKARKVAAGALRKAKEAMEQAHAEALAQPTPPPAAPAQAAPAPTAAPAAPPEVPAPTPPAPAPAPVPKLGAKGAPAPEPKSLDVLRAELEKAKGNLENTDQRVRKLGSVEAVDAYYTRDSAVGRYAKALARSLFGEEAAKLPEPPAPPAPAPAAPPEGAATRVFKGLFPEARVTDRGDLGIDHEVQFETGAEGQKQRWQVNALAEPGSNVVRLEFDEVGGAPRQPGEVRKEMPKAAVVGFGRKLQELARGYHDAGLGVSYVAKADRYEAYASALARAGFEQVSGPTGEGKPGELRVWRPLEGPPPPRKGSKAAVAAERAVAALEKAVPAEGAPALSPDQRVLLNLSNEGFSLREIAEKLGRSHEDVRTKLAEARALEGEQRTISEREAASRSELGEGMAQTEEIPEEQRSVSAPRTAKRFAVQEGFQVQGLKQTVKDDFENLARGTGVDRDELHARAAEHLKLDRARPKGSKLGIEGAYNKALNELIDEREQHARGNAARSGETQSAIEGALRAGESAGQAEAQAAAPAQPPGVPAAPGEAAPRPEAPQAGGQTPAAAAPGEQPAAAGVTAQDIGQAAAAAGVKVRQHKLLVGGKQEAQLEAGPLGGDTRQAKKMFPGLVEPFDRVTRLHGVEIPAELREQGLDQMLYLGGMLEHGSDWYFDIHADPALTNVLKALDARDWVEIFWRGKKPDWNEDGGAYMVRVTPAGRNAFWTMKRLAGGGGLGDILKSGAAVDIDRLIEVGKGLWQKLIDKKGKALEEDFDKLELTDRQRHIVKELRGGRSMQSIAKDPEMAMESGEAPNSSVVAQNRNKVLAKLGRRALEEKGEGMPQREAGRVTAEGHTVDDLLKGKPIQETLEAAGLTPRQQHVFLETRKGRGRETIRKDPEMAKEDGTPVNQELVADMREAGLDKLFSYLTGQTEANTQAKAETSREWLRHANRIRKKTAEARREGTAVPEKTGPEKPVSPGGPLEELLKTAGLNDRELHLMTERYVQGRSQPDIVNDPEMLKEDGSPMTRAGASRIEKVAKEKIRNNPELLKALQEKTLDNVEESREVIIPEHPQEREEVASRARNKFDLYNAIDRSMGELSEQYIKEAESGRLDPGREAYYQSEYAKLDRARTAGPEQEGFYERLRDRKLGRKAQPPGEDRGGAGGPSPAPEPTEGLPGAPGEEPQRGLTRRKLGAKVLEGIKGILEGESGQGEGLWPVTLAKAGYERVKKVVMGEPGKEDEGLLSRIGAGIRHIGYNLREFAGEMGPRTTALNDASGLALAHFNAARDFARQAAPDYIDRVMGPKATDADRRLVGATLTEMRLRRIHNYLRATGEADAADRVNTLVGAEGSPFRTEEDYQNALKNTKVTAALERFRKEFVPVMENQYRRAQGLEADEEINAPTQIPGMPVNLKALREGEPDTPGTVRMGGGRGNLLNVRLGKYQFARQATGAAERYDTDMGAIIENSLATGARHAAKADMVRTMVENGVAGWGTTRTPVVFDGKKGEKVPDVRPARGTQATTPGHDTLYVDPRAYDEVRQALEVDQPIRFKAIQWLNNLATRASLTSTVEAVYHSKNLLTFLMKPGVNPLDVFKNGYKLIKGDPETIAKLTELARIGALKTESGFEAGATSKYNPLTWLGKGLHFLQQSMRLTANDAFDRLVQQGRVEGGETNRRNFINQLGQYNKAAQQKAVMWLRDTGIGPFATAGSNYYMQGLRMLTMDPGVKASSMAHAIGLRAEGLARLGAVLGTAALTNYVLWGKARGDDDTPIGSIKIRDQDGKVVHWDLLNLTGATRGARQLGLKALMEGVADERPAGKIFDRAVKDVFHGAAHPATGPLVQSLIMAMTGDNSIGMKVAEKAGKDESQALENIKAAAWNFNPTVGTLAGHDMPAKRLEQTVLPRATRLLGPYGFKERAKK
jgi:DNA-binding CsgD family transcriptional regulator